MSDSLTFHPEEMLESTFLGRRYDPAMTPNETETTRGALARIHGWRTAIVSVAVVLLVCFQRPLGIDPDGITTLQWMIGANLLIDLPIARFYFPKPRFPRNRTKGKLATGRRR